MTKTPKTDKQEFSAKSYGCDSRNVVDSDFARELEKAVYSARNAASAAKRKMNVFADKAERLETELNEARAEAGAVKAVLDAEVSFCKQQQKLIEKLAGALEESCSVCCEKDDSCDTCSVREALQAYEEVKKQ